MVFILAEKVGFEPTVGLTTPVFKTGTINHSDTSPYHASRDVPDYIITIFF